LSGMPADDRNNVIAFFLPPDCKDVLVAACSTSKAKT